MAEPYVGYRAGRRTASSQYPHVNWNPEGSAPYASVAPGADSLLGVSPWVALTSTAKMEDPNGHQYVEVDFVVSADPSLAAIGVITLYVWDDALAAPIRSQQYTFDSSSNSPQSVRFDIAGRDYFLLCAVDAATASAVAFTTTLL